MTKLSIIGAGSSVFTKRIVYDLLSIEKFKFIEIALMDIDEKRLNTTHELLKKVSISLDAKPKITLHTNRKESLKGADFIQTTFQVGGYKPSTLIDFEIPKKYGLRQTIADTLGIGGIMRGLRTIPVLLEIAEDIMDTCPNALWLQYVNPMCSNMIAINKKFPEIKCLGLCHSVQGTAEMLSKDLGEKIENIDYECAGINHMAFFQKFEKKDTGENLYPKLKKIAEKIINGKAESTRSLIKENYTDKILYEKVRYEILTKFGFFVTESSEHFAEYVPWFIKKNRKDLIEKYKIPLDEYIDRCELYLKMWEDLEDDSDLLSNENIKRSNEYASYIMDAVINKNSTTINANVPNRGFIDNLPKDCCVEVPCLVNSTGYYPKKMGKLPEQLAALMRTNINVQLLTAEAALSKKRENIYHAAMLDPHTAAELSINEIYDMVDELLEAHKDFLPSYQ